jgi:N-acyl-L-homoserine lactone synthetase
MRRQPANTGASFFVHLKGGIFMSVGEIVLAEPHPIDRVTVPFESRVFDGEHGAEFFVGQVAVPGSVEMPQENYAHGRFRWNVYGEELKWVDESNRQEDGTERDADDDRSYRYGVIANCHGHSAPRMVGVSRLIVGDDLPVEQYFPDGFPKGMPKGSVEASRFIARHRDPVTQRAIALANIRLMALNAVQLDAPYVYATVERPLARYFKMLHMPFAQVSKPRPLANYGDTVNMAIRFDPREVVETAAQPVLAGTPLAQTFSENAMSAQGLGYFDMTLNDRPLERVA